MKHTPGPWKIEKTDESDVFKYAYIYDKRGLVVGTVDMPTAPTEITAPEAKENAQLIAAAPDLLEALKDILADYERRWDIDECIVNSARNAINKAEGRE